MDENSNNNNDDEKQTWLQIHPDDITNKTLKAEGAGAAVYHGFLQFPSQSPSSPKPIPVALRKPRITSTTALLRYEAELELRSKLSHPNLLPLIAACSKAPNYCTVSPWMSGGTLFDVIHTNNVNMSFTRILKLSLQLANVILYLHSNNLVHRDIKTSNILLNSQWENLKLSDLDLLKDVHELKKLSTKNNGRALHRGPSNGRLSHMVGTLVYMSPEVLSGKPHEFSSDIYAFGITINEMASAAVPFIDRKMTIPELHTVLETRFNEVKLRGAIVKNELRPVLAKGISPEFSNLIERCWKHDVNERPNAHQIVNELQQLLDKGQDHLSTFYGSTMPSVHGNGTSVSDDVENGVDGKVAENLIGEFENSIENATKPIWYDVDNSKGLDVKGALSSTCGERGEDSMEDRSIVLHNAGNLKNTHVFGIFDGHGGQECAEFAKNFFPGALYRVWNNIETTPSSSLIHAFEDLDYSFLNSKVYGDDSGCTALTLLITNNNAIHVANAGDCRCILHNEKKGVIILSKDHVASDEEEMTRIKARGGYVSITGRAQSCLMVSRAFGDKKIKRYISATPEVMSKSIEIDDDFLILASDGLWDVVTNNMAVNLVKSTVRIPEMAAKRLALKAIELGSDDNISVIVVFLRGVTSYSSLEN